MTSPSATVTAPIAALTSTLRCRYAWAMRFSTRRVATTTRSTSSGATNIAVRATR